MSGAFMMECKISLGVDAQVIHVNFQPVLGYHIGKDMIHEGLKSGWSIAEPKEHDGGFKESKRGDEHSLPLIFFLNMNVIEFPLNVEFGKNHGVFHVIDQFRDKG